MMHSFKAVAIGASAGGTKALSYLLPFLERPFPWTVFVVQHLAPDVSSDWVSIFRPHCNFQFGYQTMVTPPAPAWFFRAARLPSADRARSFASPFDRAAAKPRAPSIDVFFAAAARVFGSQLIAVLLTVRLATA